MKAYEILKNNDYSVFCEGEPIDLDEEVPDGSCCVSVGFSDDRCRKVFWHSASHVLAHAVLKLFPETKLGIGPAVEEGFYYDFIPPRPFTPEDLILIEEEMKKIIAENLKISKSVVDRDEMIMILRRQNQDLKIELVEELEGPLSYYSQGDFLDLCRGPHLRSTGEVGHVKVLSVAASYWKGDEKNKSMQRVYAIAFPSAEMLEKHLEKLEQAKLRDHRKIGREIFSIEEEGGQGLIYWHEAGSIIREEIENLWINEHRRRGYGFVRTPHIARSELWKQSGHLDYYSENMFFVEDGEFVLKPMNCPEHILIYKRNQKSYRDLPYRIAELGTVYRKERSGVLHGMLRVRGFTQDDAHIFCTADGIEQEITGVLNLALGWIERFGYEKYSIELSLRNPAAKEKYAGDDETWIIAESALKSALENNGLPFKEMPGEAVFYGPKIDFKLYDAIGRSWQGTTVQLDFNLPKRFGLYYIDSEGKEKTVTMIHRAIMGSVERFIGGLIEHYSGKFPFWLSPEQVRIIPITSEQQEAAQKLLLSLKESGIRAQVDSKNEKIGHKIRDAETSHIPLMAVIGKKELKSNSVSLRESGGREIGLMSFESLIELSLKKIEEGRKKLNK
ncbi:threonine--tRNA ligase [candidate division WOR-3 bacterium]|nr:threonine--tRNA ligase [candidate division WOR-3 bacterium]